MLLFKLDLAALYYWGFFIHSCAGIKPSKTAIWIHPVIAVYVLHFLLLGVIASTITHITHVRQTLLRCVEHLNIPVPNMVSRRHNREKLIVRSPCGKFYIKSGKNRAAAAQTSTPEVLILRSSADVLSIFNSQLKFAGSSTNVTKVHSSVGLLAAAWQSAHGGPRATVGNFCCAGQTGTADTPYGRLWVTARSSADSRAPIVFFFFLWCPNCWLLCDRLVMNNAHAIIPQSSTVSLWTVLCMCTVLCCFMLLCLYNILNDIE